jgi:FkbM family methyltransferase
MSAANVGQSGGNRFSRIEVLYTAFKASVLEVLTLGRGLSRTIDGESFRISPRLPWLFDEKKEPALRRFIRSRIRPADNFVDVGAHAGFYVMLCTRWAPNGRVIAFEPNPTSRAILMRNLRLNSLLRRVSVSDLAVSDREAVCSFFMKPADDRGHLGQVLHQDVTDELKVPTTTLDSFLATSDFKPDWLLIDIEGYEIAALRGARKTIEAGRPTMNIVVEMHPAVWAQSEASREEAQRLLAELKLRPVPLTGQSDALTDYGIVHLKYQE